MSVCHFVQPQFQLEFCMANIDETWHDTSGIEATPEGGILILRNGHG